MLTLFANSTLSVPNTNSVDPPPISITRNGPSDAGRSRVAPRNESDASSSPEITSGRTPKRSKTPSIKRSRLVASRVALVAQKRIFSTPRLAISAAYKSTAASVRVIASGWNCPVLSTPWPRRTTSISLVTSRKVSPSISAISKRMEFVPQSIAATRMARSSTIRVAQQVLHRRVD